MVLLGATCSCSMPAILSASALVCSMPVVLFAYTCQVNVFAIYDELQERRPRKMLKVGGFVPLSGGQETASVSLCAFQQQTVK